MKFKLSNRLKLNLKGYLLNINNISLKCDCINKILPFASIK